jgi:hypothetical protein
MAHLFCIELIKLIHGRNHFRWLNCNLVSPRSGSNHAVLCQNNSKCPGFSEAPYPAGHTNDFLELRNTKNLAGSDPIQRVLLW